MIPTTTLAPARNSDPTPSPTSTTRTKHSWWADWDLERISASALSSSLTATPTPSLSPSLSSSRHSWWADSDHKVLSSSALPSPTPTLIPVTVEPVTPVTYATPTSLIVTSASPTPSADTGKDDGDDLWDSLFDTLSGRIRNALDSSDELWLSDE